MTVWHWVRHGPTHQTSFTGWRDVPADLSDTAAIARLAAHLPGDAIVVSSDLDRAIKTADAVQGARVRLPHDPALREFHFGTWDGVHFSDIADRHPNLSRAYWERPGDHAPPGGESWHGFTARVWAATDRLVAAHPEGLILVVHMGVIMALIQRAASLSAYDAMNHRLPPLSLTELSARPGGGTTRIGVLL